MPVGDPPLPKPLAARGCTVVGQLGAGGMGRVFAVHDPALARTAALKIATGPAGGFAWRRLVREARITASLGGAGVVAVHELGELDDGRPWMLTSLADGRPLTELLAEPMSRAARLDAVRWVTKLAAVLGPIHRAGVVHRDLKPANVFVGERVTVLDWGLARVLSGAIDDSAAIDQTAQGARLGTPSRMSPEQASGLAADARADVWALGLLLWELLAGEPAYPGARAPEVIARILQGPPSLEPVRWAGPALGDVIAGALAPLPERTESAQALHDALVAARSPSPRRRALPWAAGLAAAAVAAAAGFALAPRPAPVVQAPVVAPALVASLADVARDAAGAGRRYRAELLAADALEAGADPALRGLLLSPAPRPVRELAVDQPVCEIGWNLAPDASLIACASTGYTSGYAIEETGVVERWRQDLEIDALQFQGASVVLGQVPAQAQMVALSAEHGGPVGGSARLATGRLMPSWRPGSALHLTPEGRGRLDVTEDGSTYDERPAPCAADLAAILPDGSELHACPGQLLRLDADRLAVVARWELPSPDDRALRMVLDASGERAALLLHSGHHGTVELDGAARWSSAPALRAGSIALSPDGRFVALGTFVDVQVWARDEPGQVLRLPGQGRLVAFDAAGRLLTVGGGRLERWRLPAASRAVQPVGGRVVELDWGAGGLLARTADGVVRRVDDGAVVARDVARVATAPNHAGVALGYADGRVEIVDGPSLSLDGLCRGLEWLAADTLVCGPAGPGPLLIDARSGEVDRRLAVPGSAWFTAAGSAAAAVALLEWSGAVYRVHGDPPQLERSVDAPWSTTLALSPNGDRVAIGGSWGAAVVDFAGADQEQRFSLPSRVSRLATSPDGRWLAATTHEGDLFVYRDGALAAHAIVQSSQTLLVAFSPDGAELALAGSAGVVERIALAELERPLAEVIAEVRAAWDPQ